MAIIKLAGLLMVALWFAGCAHTGPIESLGDVQGMEKVVSLTEKQLVKETTDAPIEKADANLTALDADQDKRVDHGTLASPDPDLDQVRAKLIIENPGNVESALENQDDPEPEAPPATLTVIHVYRVIVKGLTIDQLNQVSEALAKSDEIKKVDRVEADAGRFALAVESTGSIENLGTHLESVLSPKLEVIRVDLHAHIIWAKGAVTIYP